MPHAEYVFFFVRGMLTARHCSEAATLVFHSTHEKSSTLINPTKKIGVFSLSPWKSSTINPPPPKKIVTAWKTGALKHITFQPCCPRNFSSAVSTLETPPTAMPWILSLTTATLALALKLALYLGGAAMVQGSPLGFLENVMKIMGT
jgi:hypothetical protein